MPICYVFHSETGHTRRLIDRCAAAAGGDKIEIKDLENYGRITKFLRGGKRARQGLLDPIDPAEVDVTNYSTVVIGSPVWAGMPTPAVNAAIKALKGAEDKKAIIVVSCGGNPGQSLEVMQKAVEEKKMIVTGSMAFTVRDLRDEERVNSLIDLVKRTNGPEK
ncbi:MAG: NAD(P)H-dependent oxidoreductase [Methanomicrobiales archaeon]|nr:NAD(P)H-dependent oxidoreductase [Methanomicrobiales archaeon]